MNVGVDTISPESKGSRLADRNRELYHCLQITISSGGINYMGGICDPLAVPQLRAEKLLNF